jgi:hypothetical protein
MRIQIDLNIPFPMWARRATQVGVVALVLGASAVALGVPSEFVANTPLSSKALNDNFKDLEARLKALETRPGVGSPAPGLNVASALLDSHGAGSIAAADGDWVSAVTKNGTGQVIVTLKPGVFAGTPNCVAGTQNTAAGGAWFALETASSTSLFVTIIGRTGTVEEREFSLICVGK